MCSAKDLHAKYKIYIYISHGQHAYGNRASSAIYRQTSNIRHTVVGNEIVDHSDVVGAAPVGAAPTTSSFLI